MKRRILITAALVSLLSLTASAQLNGPSGLAFDSHGNLWVANSGNNQVLELNPANGTVLNTITEDLNGPSRLFFESGIDLCVTNLGGNDITVYNTQTLKQVQKISSSKINFPLGVAVDTYGDVFIANNQGNSVIALNIGGRLAETLTQDNSGFKFVAPGAMAIRGQVLYVSFGSTATTDAVLSYNIGEFLTGYPKEYAVYNDNVNTGPTGIAFDAAGNVYISEFYSNTWVKYGPNGGNPLLVVSDGISHPEGIALDKNGNIYVANASQNTITVYDPSGKLINTIK